MLFYYALRKKVRIIEIFKLFGSIMVDSDAAEKSISKTGKQAEGMGKKLGSGIKTAAKWGAAIAGGAVLAGGAIAAIAAPLVKAAANATAMNAQFEQVFGDMQKGAQKTIDELGKDFGMLPNRIKPAFSQMTSMFKGLGMDTETAMKTAENAVTLTADAAAFYDKSFEDANSALNSFIKGNYEGGEAIGLFGSAATMAAYASEELGQDWKTLDEAGKQVVRLKFAEAMQESAGATGQAARESGSLENQLGNLKQAWEDIKAKFGAPILEPAVAMIQRLADYISKVDVDALVVKFETFATKATSAAKIVGDFFQNDVKPKIQAFTDWLEPKLPAIKEAFETAFDGTKKAIEDTSVAIQDATKWFQDHWNILQPILAGIAGGAVAFYVITGAIALYNAALLFSMGLGPIYIAMTAGMTAVTAGFAAVLAFLLSPAFLIALAIAALIAIGVLLYKNWDTIVIKAKALGVFLSATFNHIKTVVVQKVMEMVTGAINKFNELKTKAIVKFAEILAAAGTKFNAIKSAIMDPINAAKDKVKAAVDKIKGFFTGMKLNLPKIKVPSFKLKNWSKNPLDWIGNMPSIGINWNAKGALFTKPTVFNTPMGLQGFGEAGPEAAIPLNSTVLGMIGDKIAQTMEVNNGSQIDNRPVILQTFLDGKMIAEVIEPSMSKLLARKINNAGRGEFA